MTKRHYVQQKHLKNLIFFLVDNKQKYTQIYTFFPMKKNH